MNTSNRRRIAEENAADFVEHMTAHQLRKLAITLHGDRAIEEHHNANLARRYAQLAREHDNTTRLLHSLRRIVADGAISTGARIGELDRSTQARLDRLSREVHARAIRGHDERNV